MKLSDKEKFCRYVNFIINQHEKELKLKEAMQNVSPDFFVDFYPFSQYEAMFVELLNEKYNLEKDSFGQTDLEYYLYELDYGKNWDKFGIEEVDKETIYLKSPEILYDFITGELNKK